MSIDLSALQVNRKTLVQKSNSPGFHSILHAVPVRSRTKVQKAANKPKLPTRKSDQPMGLKKTPNCLPSSTIGNNGRPNATSNVGGAPAAVDKPSGIEALFAAVNALTAAVTIATAPKASTANMDKVLEQSRREDHAAAFNAGRSAAQRQGFTFHAAKLESTTVNLGKSAHAVRMNGNIMAPAPAVTRKTEIRKAWFNDTYMQRISNQKK